MRRNAVTCLIASVILLLVGCSMVPSGVPESEAPMHTANMTGGSGQSAEETKTFNASYDVAWNATVESIQEVGYPLINTSKESGSLTTDWLERAGGPFCIGMPMNTFKDRFSIRVVRTSDSSTKVGIRRSVEKIDGIRSTPASSNGVTEKWLLEKITEKIK